MVCLAQIHDLEQKNNSFLSQYFLYIVPSVVMVRYSVGRNQDRMRKLLVQYSADIKCKGGWKAKEVEQAA